MAGRQHQLHRRLGRRHGHRQETACRQDVLFRGRRRLGQARSPRPTSSSSAGSRFITTIRRGTKSSPSNFAEFTDADGQVIPDPTAIRRRITSGSSPPGPTKGGSPISASPAFGTANWYDARVQRHEGLHDHRPARLPARAEGEVQVLDSPRPIRHAATRSEFANQDFTVEIHNPKGEKIVSENEEDRRLRRHRGRICHSGRRHVGRLWAERREPRRQHARRRQFPRRRVQEARVRSDGRRPRPSRSCWAKRSPPRSRPNTTSARP